MPRKSHKNKKYSKELKESAVQFIPVRRGNLIHRKRSPFPFCGRGRHVNRKRVSLRLGHLAAPDCPRQSIHYRSAASLPFPFCGRGRQRAQSKSSFHSNIVQCPAFFTGDLIRHGRTMLYMRNQTFWVAARAT